MDASDARLDAPAEPTADQRARLVAELEKLEMKTIGSGPALAAPTPDGGTKVPGPQAVVQMAAAVGGPAGSNAVLARARAGFRRCYQRALAEDPETAGAVTLTLAVGPDGNVTQATSATTHSNAEVAKMWDEYSEVCEYVPLANLAEAKQLFSEFTPLEDESA
jgi:hypothetical protein